MLEIIQGFLLGGSLIVAIGAQNAFVLSQSLKHNHEWLIASICLACDAVLILLGVLGLPYLAPLFSAQVLLGLKWLMTILGALVLVYYGYLSFRAMLRHDILHESLQKPLSKRQAVLTTLSLTLLNPHVYLDTVVLVGTVANTRFPETAAWFALGACLASFCWFYGLTAFAKLLSPLFKHPRTWQILNGLIALTMWSIAFSLVRFMWSQL